VSGVATLCRLDGQPADPGALTALLKHLEGHGPDGTDSLVLGPAALGCARLDTLPQDGPQPVRLRGVCAVADARLDNRDDLESELGLLATCSDAAIIAAAVAKWGVNAPTHLDGDFAVVAWDGVRLLAFRDRFGVRPLFYTEVSGVVFVASTVRALLLVPGLAGKPEREYFLEQLAAQVPSTTRTPIAGIHRLGAAHCLIVAPHRPLLVSRYYELKSMSSPRSHEEAATTTRALLREGVRQRLRATGRVACDVSGGMDSTSIYALSRTLGPPPLALSLVSERWPTLDERRYSQPLIGHSPWIQVLAEEHLPFAQAEADAAHFGEPVQDIIFRARLALVEALPTGCRVILSGHGGDGTMSGAPGLFAHLAASRRYLALYREARVWADLRDIPLGGVLKRAGRRWSLVAPALPWASPRVARAASETARALSEQFLQKANHRVDASIFLAFTEAGIRQAPTVPTDLRYPFLYRPLIEYALSLEPSQKAGAGVDKRVLRSAIAGLLPQSVLERKIKTGFTSAYSYAALLHWPKIEAWLEEPRLAELDILDAAGFRRLAKRLRDGQGELDGDIIYALADEVWLRDVFDHAAGSPAYDGPIGGR
jgi:asparagine synthase (glutamine-hydrolysing)